MVKNTGFIGSQDTSPYKFQHYDITAFSLFVNENRSLMRAYLWAWITKNTSVMGYRTLFESFGTHHSNSGLQITHDMYINGYFMLLFDLTPDRGASKGQTPHP